MNDEPISRSSRRRVMGLAASVFTAGAAGGSYAAQTPLSPQLGRNDSVFFDVTRFGAVPDGKTKNTAALQRAIDAFEAGDTAVANNWMNAVLQEITSVDIQEARQEAEGEYYGAIRAVAAPSGRCRCR